MNESTEFAGEDDTNQLVSLVNVEHEPEPVGEGLSVEQLRNLPKKTNANHYKFRVATKKLVQEFLTKKSVVVDNYAEKEFCKDVERGVNPRMRERERERLSQVQQSSNRGCALCIICFCLLYVLLCVIAIRNHA